MSNLSFIKNRATDFISQINRFSMTFLNSKYENEFIKYKFEKKNLLISIAITIYFVMIVMGNAFINIPLGVLDSLKVVQADIKDLLCAIFWYASLLIELVIFFIPKLRLGRGFFIATFPMIAITYRSYIFSTVTYKMTTPIFIPVGVLLGMIIIITSFIYAANWICGTLQIVIFITIFEFFILYFDWGWNSNKPILMLLVLITPICVIMAIYYFEYFQRKAIFLKIEAENLAQHLNDIINKIPVPLIISQKGEILYSNHAFSSIQIKDHSDESSISESEKGSSCPQEEKKDITFESLTKDKLDKLTQIVHQVNRTSFKNVIENDKEIDSEYYIIKNSKKITHYFEISSVLLSFQNEKFILYLLTNLTQIHRIKKLREKEKFLRIYFASISHDFRTPLGIIMGNSEILLTFIENQEQREYITNIYNSSTIILLLIQDILDYSQLKSGTLKMNPRNFNINKEFQMIVGLFKEKYANKRLYLNLNINNPIPLMAYNDSDRIKQVLMNLLSNAYKFTKNGGVNVNILFEKGYYTVTVTDTGVGMNEEDETNLFKEFGRLDRHQDINPSGIGLGLHICKKLVTKMGGTIYTKSKINEGTSFIFTFLEKFVLQEENVDSNHCFDDKNGNNLSSSRICNYDEEKDPQKNSLPIPLRYKNLDNLKIKKFCQCSRILIVDDDYGIRKVIKAFAKRGSINYDEAENGLEALQKVKLKLAHSCCQCYRIIFTDNNMPEMDGITSSILIHKELQANEKNETKIILVSGISIDESDQIKKLDFNPFFRIESKPLTLKIFKEITLSYL